MIKVTRFTADWCGPCRTLAPILNELQIKYRNEPVFFETVNVDLDPLRAENNNIKSVPTVIIYHHSREVDRITGLASREAYLNAINKAKLWD